MNSMENLFIRMKFIRNFTIHATFTVNIICRKWAHCYEIKSLQRELNSIIVFPCQVMLIVSSITGLTVKDCQPQGKRRRGAANEDGALGADDNACEEEGGDEEDGGGVGELERELPDDIRPGLSFWIVLNVAAGLCDDFMENIRSRFVENGFMFSSLKVRFQRSSLYLCSMLNDNVTNCSTF